MATTGFRNLLAYRLAVEIADDLHGAVGRWSSLDHWTVGIQLLRAADSIGANIAESAGRWHTPDRRRLLFIARGSLYEAEHWILRAQNRALLADGYVRRLDEVARALNGLIKKPTPG
jgi:four helix bundle protein